MFPGGSFGGVEDGGRSPINVDEDESYVEQYDAIKEYKE